MDWNIFNFFRKQEDEVRAEQEKDKAKTFVEPYNDDGSTQIVTQEGPSVNSWHHVQHPVNFSTDVTDVKTLIDSYRTIADYPEVDDAIQEIVDEAIVHEDSDDAVSLNLESSEFSENIQKKIHDEFNNVLNLFHFRKKGAQYFRKWYIDSRIYFQKIPNQNEKEGLKELRLLDPKRIEKIREVIKEKGADGIEVVKRVDEYYSYISNDYESQQFVGMAALNQDGGRQKLRVPNESIAFAWSGILDETDKNIVGHLHRAIKPVNQLKMLEDAVVIYRVARAPERRVFYVDVGNLPRTKAEQYLANIRNGMSKKVVYDSAKGKVKTAANVQSILEDIWLPRREGTKGTEVSTLPGGQNLGEMEDVDYFNTKTMKALHVPDSRMKADSFVQLGNSGEISRDEMRFAKFVARLRERFGDLLLDVLRTQLLMKNIITADEWKENVERIILVYAQDSYYREAAEAELLENRIGLADRADQYVGKYFSREYVRKHVLRQSEDQIEAMNKQMEEEEKLYGSEEDEDDGGFGRRR